MRPFKASPVAAAQVKAEAKVNALEARLAELEGSTQQRFDAITEKVNKTAKEASATTARMGSLEEYMKTLAGHQAQRNQTCVVMSSRIEEIRAEISRGALKRTSSGSNLQGMPAGKIQSSS